MPVQASVATAPQPPSRRMCAAVRPVGRGGRRSPPSIRGTVRLDFLLVESGTALIQFDSLVMCVFRLTIQDVHGHCIKIVWSYRAGIVSRVLFANLGYRQRGVGTVVHQICAHAVRNNFIRNALAINRITFAILCNDVIICLRFVCSFIRHKTSGSVKSNE